MARSPTSCWSARATETTIGRHRRGRHHSRPGLPERRQKQSVPPSLRHLDHLVRHTDIDRTRSRPIQNAVLGHTRILRRRYGTGLPHSPRNRSTSTPWTSTGGGVDALSLELAPLLMYDQQEAYWADSAAEMTNNYVPGSYSNTLKTPSTSYPPGGTVIAAADPADPSGNLSLDYLGTTYPGGTTALADDWIDAVDGGDGVGTTVLEDYNRMQDDPQYPNRAYVRRYPLSGGETIIQYWLWYYDNPKAFEGFGDHEGDWEFVQYHLDVTGAPVSAAYSIHYFGMKCPWIEVPTSGGRPAVYVGEGSHANYFQAGRELRRQLERR